MGSRRSPVPWVREEVPEGFLEEGTRCYVSQDLDKGCTTWGLPRLHGQHSEPVQFIGRGVNQSTAGGQQDGRCEAG